MICANSDCGPNTITTVFGASGLRSFCRKCGAAPALAVVVPPPAPEVAPTVTALSPAPAAPTPRPRAPRLTGGNVLALARAEAKELKREIRTLEAKKRHLAELQRLISAAAKKPSEGASNVRQLRKTGL